MTPTDWMPDNIAVDCLWYEEYDGQQTCVHYGCSLGIDDDRPCILCKEYTHYEPGAFTPKGYSLDRNGQYRIAGV